MTRRNRGGALEVVTHGRLRAAAVDPVEKKPLFHFRPGTSTFSVAAAGCNLVCPFCQNHSLSQGLRDERYAPEVREWAPAAVVDAALEAGCRSISFTYSEPVLSLEFAAQVAELAGPAGLDIVFVTNGQIAPGPARDLAGFLGAANVDLKCFDADAYRRRLGGSLDATLDTIRTLAAAGVWVEVTTLVVPGFSDGGDQLRAIARFIAGVDRSMPWHLSRFHPAHEWDHLPPTSPLAIEAARAIGREEGLEHVYSGNLPGDDGEKTRCPGCAALIVDRVGYRVGRIETDGGRCRRCGAAVAGIGFP
jgi:pyruvate formate lyase activating enzyme